MNELLVILFYVVGIALLFAEVLLPGGVLGVIGLLVLIGSVVAAFAVSQSLGVTLTVVSVIIVPGIVVLVIRVIKRYMAIKGTQAGVSVHDDAMAELAGQEGVAETPLHPSGMARIGDRRVDVVTLGDMIDKGVRVKVVEVRGNRVVVRKSAL